MIVYLVKCSIDESVSEEDIGEDSIADAAGTQSKGKASGFTDKLQTLSKLVKSKVSLSFDKVQFAHTCEKCKEVNIYLDFIILSNVH